MGADFVYSLVPAVEITDRRLDELRALVASLQREDFDDNEFDEEMDLDACRQAIIDALDFIDAGRRDVGTIKTAIMPCAYLLSGGMSWGDDVTDAQEQFSLIEGCDPVWRRLEAWAQEDR